MEVELGDNMIRKVLFTPQRPGFLVATSESRRRRSCVQYVALAGTTEPLWCGTWGRAAVLRGAGEGQAVLYPSGEGQATLFSLGHR